MSKILKDIIRLYQKSINPTSDEVFFEFSDGIESVEQTQFVNTPIERISIRTFFLCFLCILVFLGGYLMYLVVSKGESNLLVAQKNAQDDYNVISSRGQIITTDNTIVALSQDAFNVVATPALFENERQIELIVNNITHLYPNTQRNTLFNRLASGYRRNQSHAVVLKNLNSETVAPILPLIDKYDSLSLETARVRSYPFGEMFSHIVGYIALVNKQEIEEKGYSFIDYVGRQGVESQFDTQLRGVDGVFRKYIGSLGNTEGESLVQEPEQGGNVVLTVDFKLQQIVYEELKQTLEQEEEISAGTVVALDPRNGAVRAMVSMPAFDPNVLLQELTQQEIQAYFASDQTSFFNRATMGAYPAGSVIKPLIAVGALEEGIIHPNTEIITDGSITVRSVYDPNVSWTFLDWKNHGVVDMRRAIAVSSNVYFYAIGGGYNNVQGLGINNIVKWLNTFYWGKELGINFDNERAGVVPTPEWKQQNKGQEWYIGDTYNTAIGQGDILVTPLQIASSLSAVVNGGLLYKPYLVDRIEGASNTGTLYFPDILAQNIAQQESLGIVKQGMRQAVLEGSSRLLQAVPVQVAGKTGTAQASNENNHALFAGFAPYQDPELVFAVLLEKGQKSTKAVALTHDILQRYYAPNAD